MLTQRMLGTTPMALLISLSIRLSWKWRMSYHLALPAFVCDHFPGITSLQLDIPWSLRNVALIMALSQHNVRTMELSILTVGGLGRWRLNQVEALNYYPRNNMLPGPLQSLTLDVVQRSDELEQGLVQCSRWIDDDVVHPMTGLGGSNLKSIDVLHESGFAGKQKIWRRWVKLPDGDWRIEGTL